MVSSEVQRTLVKSAPELWAELSDEASLARHLGEFGAIRITRTTEAERIEWEAERARGSIVIKSSGWGTRVTLTAEREPASAHQPPESAAPGESDSPPGAPPAASAVAPPPASAAPAPAASARPAPATSKPPPSGAKTPAARAAPATAATPAPEPTARTKPAVTPDRAVARPPASSPPPENAPAARTVMQPPAGAAVTSKEAQPKRGILSRLVARWQKAVTPPRDMSFVAVPREPATPTATAAGPPTSEDARPRAATATAAAPPRSEDAKPRADATPLVALEHALLVAPAHPDAQPAAAPAASVPAPPTPPPAPSRKADEPPAASAEAIAPSGGVSGQSEPKHAEPQTAQPAPAAPLDAPAPDAPAPDERATGEVHAALSAVLDSLGAAHHRPFSRS
jgi:hypothetical protein